MIRNTKLRISSVLLALLALSIVAAAVPHDKGADVNLRNDMRRLWEDHVTWTRLHIVSALAGLPDKDAAAGRLLQNQPTSAT